MKLKSLRGIFNTKENSTEFTIASFLHSRESRILLARPNVPQ